MSLTTLAWFIFARSSASSASLLLFFSLVVKGLPVSVVDLGGLRNGEEALPLRSPAEPVCSEGPPPPRVPAEPLCMESRTEASQNLYFCTSKATKLRTSGRCGHEDSMPRGRQRRS